MGHAQYHGADTQSKKHVTFSPKGNSGVIAADTPIILVGKILPYRIHRLAAQVEHTRGVAEPVVFCVWIQHPHTGLVNISQSLESLGIDQLTSRALRNIDIPTDRVHEYLLVRQVKPDGPPRAFYPENAKMVLLQRTVRLMELTFT